MTVVVDASDVQAQEQDELLREFLSRLRDIDSQGLRTDLDRCELLYEAERKLHGSRWATFCEALTQRCRDELKYYLAVGAQAGFFRSFSEVQFKRLPVDVRALAALLTISAENRRQVIEDGLDAEAARDALRPTTGPSQAKRFVDEHDPRLIAERAEREQRERERQAEIEAARQTSPVPPLPDDTAAVGAGLENEHHETGTYLPPGEEPVPDVAPTPGSSVSVTPPPESPTSTAPVQRPTPAPTGGPVRPSEDPAARAAREARERATQLRSLAFGQTDQERLVHLKEQFELLPTGLQRQFLAWAVPSVLAVA